MIGRARYNKSGETTMQASSLSREEAGHRAQALYEDKIRWAVETPENIGKLVVIDIETGDYGVDELGFAPADALRAANPSARLIALRIGYNVAASFGGLMERVRR